MTDERKPLRSRFLPGGLIVIHPTGAQPVAEFARLARLAERSSNAPYVPVDYQQNVLEDFCKREHELVHYEQHTTTAVGGLLMRLRFSRRYAAAHALEDCIQTYGRLRSLSGLIAVENARTGSFVSNSKVLSENGVRNLQFWEFLTKTEAAILGVTWSQRAVKTTWDSLFGVSVMAEFLGLDRVGAFSHPVQLVVQPEELTFNAEQTNLNGLLEASARLREFQIRADSSNDVESLRTFLVEGDSSYWLTIAKVCERLDVAVNHPIVRVLHDISLQTLPDPELLVGSDVHELDWNRDHPGRFFDRALVALEERGVPRKMNTAESYDLLASVMALDDTSLPYRVALTRAGGIDPVADVLERRHRVSSVGYECSLRANDPSPLYDFAALTLSAALRLRSEDPAAFSYQGMEASDLAQDQLRQIRLQPFVLHDNGFDTYPSVNPDPDQHVFLVADAVYEVVLDELADSSSCALAETICNAIGMTSGDSMRDAVIALVLDRLPPMLSEVVAQELRGAGYG